MNEILQLPKKCTTFKNCSQRSQVGIVVISHASHLYDPGLSPGLCMWAEICLSQLI